MERFTQKSNQIFAGDLSTILINFLNEKGIEFGFSKKSLLFFFTCNSDRTRAFIFLENFKRVVDICDEKVNEFSCNKTAYNKPENEIYLQIISLY